MRKGYFASPSLAKPSLIGRLLGVLLALALAGPVAASGTLTAELDRTRVAADGTVTLRLTAQGDLPGQPNLAPLETDFEILGQSSGTSMSIANGAMSQSRSWTFELAPRHTGHMTIPALSMGGAMSRPLALEVVESGQEASDDGLKPIFLDTHADTQSPYVQQGFDYRVRVLYREQPRRATLSEPTAEGAIVERVGEDQTYPETVDGQRYTVIERRYRVVPQRSGALQIRSPGLEALVADRTPGARRSPFADLNDAFDTPFFRGLPNLADRGAGRRVIERGPDLTVEVRPQPDGSGPDWLPAESIQLTDEWTPEPPRFRVGEPVTRTLAITAHGASGAQLPTLDPGTPEGARVYPEPPKIEDLPGSGAPSALKTLRVALVPSRPGPLTLPEIRLPWWDTVADRARVAVIPQRTVQVGPAAGDAAAAAPPSQSQNAPAAAPATQPHEPPTATGGVAVRPLAGMAQRGQEPPTLAGPGTPAGNGPWRWIALALGGGWLATLFWQWRRGRSAPPDQRPGGNGAPPRTEPLRAARAAVRQACLDTDPRAARTALLAWGRSRWRGAAPRGLGELAARLGGGQAAAALDAIDRANYGAATRPWDGPGVWTWLGPLLLAAERETQGQSVGPLPELYPDASG